MAEETGNMTVEDGYFWVDSDDSGDKVDDQPDGYFWVDSDDSGNMVDDQPKDESADLPAHEVVDSVGTDHSPSDSDVDDAETLEAYFSGILALPRKRGIVEAFLCKDLQSAPSIRDVVKEHVLPFLPAKSLCRSRTVCKEWDRWVASPFFAHRHAQVFQGISGVFSQTPYGDTSFTGLDSRVHGVPDPSLGFLPEQVFILASHNGLLCCRGQETGYYYVCNPVTKKWERLPNSNCHHWSKTAVGLALDADVFNFKANFEIICVIPQPDSEFVIFEIYSSRTNSWRDVTVVCPELQDGNLIGNSLYGKGYVYWMVDSGFILVLDKKNEEFGIVKLPAGCGPSCALSELRGELCFLEPWVDALGHHYVRIYGGMEMKLNDTVRLYVRHKKGEEGSFRALGLANDNVLLLLLGRKLIAYHMTEKTGRVLDPWVMNADFMRYLPYINSLVEVCKPSSEDY